MSCPEKDDNDSDLDTTSEVATKQVSAQKSNEYSELGVSKIRGSNFDLIHKNSSLNLSAKLLSQEGISVDTIRSIPKSSLDCTNLKQDRKFSQEMELTSLHGRKANNPHKLSCRTQNIPFKNAKKNFCLEDDFILEEDDDENLDVVKEPKISNLTLTRQKTATIGDDLRIRSFSSIFSKLENINKHVKIDHQDNSDSD